MSNLLIYNTESKTKEPITKNAIRLYTCGPTVYDHAHIGNFRTYVFEDLLRRTLKFFGIEVTQAMNLTDVDDKTIRRSIEEGIPLEEYTKKYKEQFFADLKSLEIEPVEFYPSATEYIQEMIEMIEVLIEKGLAYQGSTGDVFFNIKKFPNYGRLSHLKLDDLKIGGSERVTADEYDKESPSDFVLWKGYDEKRDGKVFWESPFGRGRPGWHIECSAMATKLLGKTIDIHVGGVDNIFPHHENEIAQSEGCFGHHFVNHWIHVEHLIVDGKKMSKSLGNFYTLKDLIEKGFSGREVRYLLLSTHYRTQLNFTLEGLKGARSALRRLGDFIDRLQGVKTSESDEDFTTEVIEKARQGFEDALKDDLNISLALSFLFDMLREVNTLLDHHKISEKGANHILLLLKKLDKVLGCLPFERDDEVPQEIVEALRAREEARQTKNWALADQKRDYIQSQGYVIEDSPSGSKVKKK